MDKDYYGILGVQKNATKDEIKKAYRKLAHQHHPDKTGGDEKKFKELNEAYYILGNDQRRSEYDRYGRVFTGGGPANGGGFSGFEGFDFSNFTTDFPDLSEIFGDFFGFAGKSNTRKRRGRDISIDLELSFEESVLGAGRKVLITKAGACDQCKGSGAAPDAVLKTCHICQGSGKLRETKQSFFGNFSTVKTCDECAGTGKTPSKKCRNCKGEGVIRQPEEISLEIPAGIYDGEVIKLTGKGEAVSRGIAGDLYVKIHVKPDPVFKREGNDLIMELNIPLSEALLGGERKIKMLNGEEMALKIPQGINYGEILRIKNKGIPYRDGSRGNLLIKILVKIPKNLSKNSKKLIEELKKEGI